MKGKLIVIEGLDGSGKSTQLDLAAGFLKERGVRSRVVSFPNYDTLTGQLVERYLRGDIKCEGKNGAYSASLLYSMDRFVSFSTDWKDFYETGGVVVAGRYTTSNAIYQLAKMPTEEYEGFLEWLYDFEYNKLGLPRPDKVLFLDMPVEISQRLLKKRYEGDEKKKDIHEKNVPFLMKCRECAMYAAYEGGWSVINCSRHGLPLPIEEVYVEICGQIMQTINS